MKTILIIGMGQFGSNLAYKLQSLGNEICVADSSEERINLVSSDFENAYIADCTNIQALKNLGPNNYDICFVAIGDNFQSSLEITSLLKELGAKYVISKSSSDIQTKFLHMAGADETVYPEKDIIEKIALTSTAKNVLDYFKLTKKLGIYEITPPKQWLNKTLKELAIPNKYNVSVVAIVKNKGEALMPKADTIIKESDLIYIMGDHKDVTKIVSKK